MIKWKICRSTWNSLSRTSKLSLHSISSFRFISVNSWNIKFNNTRKRRWSLMSCQLWIRKQIRLSRNCRTSTTCNWDSTCKTNKCFSKISNLFKLIRLNNSHFLSNRNRMLCKRWKPRSFYSNSLCKLRATKMLVHKTQARNQTRWLWWTTKKMVLSNQA